MLLQIMLAEASRGNAARSFVSCETGICPDRDDEIDDQIGLEVAMRLRATTGCDQTLKPSIRWYSTPFGRASHRWTIPPRPWPVGPPAVPVCVEHTGVCEWAGI